MNHEQVKQIVRWVYKNISPVEDWVIDGIVKDFIESHPQPASQDLRERAMDLWTKHSFIERSDKIVRALMTIDSFLFCVGALDEQKDKRIAELEKQVFELIDFNKLNDPL